MKTHDMHLKPEPFSKIEKGTKVYELRLFDEKRRLISIGDTIRFESFDGRTLTAEVIALEVAKNFKELILKLGPHKCGFENESIDDAVSAMEEYYPAEKQNKYAVVGIGIKVIGVNSSVSR